MCDGLKGLNGIAIVADVWFRTANTRCYRRLQQQPTGSTTAMQKFYEFKIKQRKNATVKDRSKIYWPLNNSRWIESRLK